MYEHLAHLKRPINPVPEFLQKALAEAGLADAYRSRPPYQQNDYIGWILKAKQPETQKKRLDAMLKELKANSGYMGLYWKPGTKKG